MPETTRESDGTLLARARAGSNEAFAELVDRHKNSLVGYLTRLTGEQDHAEDLAQEAFLRLYERSSYEERGLLRAYLFRIALNLLRSQQRRKARWRRLRTLLLSSNGAEAAPTQEASVHRRELREALRRGLAALPLHYRAPLLLHDVDGWRYREICEALGCEEGTVKSRIHRGRRLLRQELTSHVKGLSA